MIVQYVQVQFIGINPDALFETQWKEALRACIFKYVYIDEKYIIYSTMTGDFNKRFS